MAFNPGLNIGQSISHNQLVEIFRCGNMGGMRPSHATNTLVLVSDYTKGLYQDKWIGGTLHYTGSGKKGDQDLHDARNAALAGYRDNGVDVHLFEVIDEGEYIYCGRIELVGDPYTETQPDEDGNDRLVWMFPVRPVPDNNVRKPGMFVFSDMADYQARGKNVDAEYAKLREQQRRSKNSIIGKTVTHQTNGKGTVKSFDGKMITITFHNGSTKSFNYQICIEKQLLEIE